MAITNAMIVFNAQQRLLTEGKIKTTGRLMEFYTPDGDKTFVPEPEAIHTFAHWKELGFIVRKGEHAVDCFPVWKYTTKAKDLDEEEAQEQGFCFMKTAYWFSASQVDPIQ